MRSAPRLWASAMLAATVSLTACGGPSKLVSSAEGPSTTRGPLAALPARTPFALRIALRRLRGTALGDAMPSLARETKASDAYGAWMRACKVAPIDAFHEVLVAMGQDELLIAAELAMSADEALRCMRQTFGGKDANFQERPAIRLERGKEASPLFITIQGQLLLVGDEASLAEAVELVGSARPLAACLDLGAEAFLVGCGASPALVAKDVKVLMRSSGAGFAAEATLQFDDATSAKELGERVDAGKKAAAHEPKFVRDALDTLKVTMRGTAAEVRAGTQGDGVAQAGYLVALATGARRALWEQEARALAEEARVNVAALAEALRKNAPEKPRVTGPIFPVAPPPSPEKIPRAALHTPLDTDFAHATWTALGFAPKGPLRYQYELFVSQDRRRAIARARGDLDGNGRNSLFEIVVEAKGGAIVVSPMKVLEETE
ncbi:MAG: hypothetical protein IPG50_08660 [Myxococcales bacterium]|nr:hypothetical protein [Myxococcales bacterium]